MNSNNPFSPQQFETPVPVPVPVSVPDGDVTMQEGGEQPVETRKRLWERPGGEGTLGVLSLCFFSLEYIH